MISTPRRIRQRSSLIIVFYRLADTLAIAGGLALVSTISTFEVPTSLSGAAAVILYFVLAEARGTYRNWRGISPNRELASAVGTWVCTVPLMFLGHWLYDRVSDTPAPWSPAALLEWSLITTLLLSFLRLGARGVQRLLRAGGIHVRGFAVLGVNELGFQLAKNIGNTPDLGLTLVGFFDDRPPHRVPPVPPEIGKRVGDIQQLIEMARAGEIDRIYITLPMRAEERIRRLLTELSDSTASVYIVPDFFVFELLHSCWTDIGGLPVVAVFDHPFYGVDGILKRVTDFVLASLLLVFLSVPMLLVAAAVKLTSPGPVFFRQRRYGMDGREIRVWKFRTMNANEDGAVVRQATRNDERITCIGGFLRRTSLDELPQLFNVLGGSMSLVGPRPHATAHNEEYRRHIRGYMLRHKVRPGITGLAQINGWRGETDTLYKMEKRIEFDHQYIREWSLWKDFKILFRTISTIFKRENAY
ncbi:MAG TPA: undecaprenyl-phosphate glucose phosphotransferase [Pirellulales bacterium]|jgi:putative colanic acid biosynthesis UDP-glucose lipid carrier transferase|nr:undecaprenyl-phosphate glucose phosphotransferase [Pirellulales bacterium]